MASAPRAARNAAAGAEQGPPGPGEADGGEAQQRPVVFGDHPVRDGRRC